MGETSHNDSALERGRQLLRGSSDHAEDTPSDSVIRRLKKVNIKALGGFAVTAPDGANLLSGQRATRPGELLKTMLAMGGRGVRATAIARALWPRVDSQYGYASFTVTLHRLRRRLRRNGAVTLESGRVGLNPDLVAADTWALEDFMRDLDRQDLREHQLVDFDSTATLLERLTELYSGAFLVGESELRCVVAFREHLRGNLTRCLRKLMTRMESLGRWDLVTDCYERFIDVDPLCEGLYRELMTSLARQGRLGELVATFERCCSSMLTVRQEGPSEATRILYGQLLRTG